MNVMRLLICCSILWVLCGCAAVGVPLSSDPNQKLNYAASLMEDWGPEQRPLPAERLIQEAMDIARTKGDDVCLANAYRIYAFFLDSKAVENWELHYRKYGFIDKSISFDNRKQKSIEYFEKARDIYESKLMYGAVTNIYYSLSLLYYWNHQQKEACDALEKSLESHLKFKRSNPGVRITLPDGFSSYEAYVDAAKKECGCI